MTGIVDFRTELLDEDGNPITASNPLPVTGGGGGGGGVLSDTVFVDSTGQLFVYRDTGSGTPNAYEIPAWTLYTPVGTVTSASSGNAAASATGSAVPGSADYVGFNSGGNLVGVSSSNPFPVSVGNFPATQPVSGSVSVSNFPATQPVSGSVSVSNFPATQNVNIVGGSSGNAAAGTTGAAVPSSADYVGYNSGGNLVGVSSATPLPVNVVAGSSGNAAASATGAAVPASADYIGFNVGGNLTGVSATNPLPTSDITAEATRQDMVTLLVRMLNYLNAPMGYDKSLQRQRGTVVLESGTVTTVSTVTTVTTVTTVAAVTSLNNIDGYNGRMPVLDQNRVAWAQCVRARIT